MKLYSMIPQDCSGKVRWMLNELGIFSVMWSEHCGYKNSKPLIKTLPMTGNRVLHGPGENAGIVDIGDGWAVCFKIVISI